MVRHRGFTLVELITVAGLAAIMSGLLLPAVSRQREDAKSRQCVNNLRTIGISIFLFADGDPKMRFCSGAPDYMRDGSPDTWGWLADGINQGAYNSTSLFCPASEARGTAFLNQLYRLDPGSPEIVAPAKRSRDGICGRKEFPGSGIRGKAKTDFFAGTRKKTDERKELIARWFLEQSYNTNYTASWSLVRTGPRFNRAPIDFITQGERKSKAMTGLDSTVGPLTLILVESSPIAASRIPFLGCGTIAEDSYASFGYGSESMKTFADGSVAEKTFVKIGDGLVAPYNKGPAIWNRKTKRIEHAKVPGTSLKATATAEAKLEPINYLKSKDIYLQDTRGWFAWHEGRKDSKVNLLFADGSVRGVVDVNHDGLINPGFPAVEGDKQSARFNGYVESRVEVDPQDIYLGVFIRDPRPKATFGEDPLR